MATIRYNKTLTETDPQNHPVLIVGQLRHLSILNFNHVKSKLGSRVTEETFQSAITCLHPSPTDVCPLYLDLATIAALPIKCSRHNTSSRAHALTRLVKTHSVNVTETIVVILIFLLLSVVLDSYWINGFFQVVCDKKDLYASGCAVARAFPLYSRKSGSSENPPPSTVNVEFILIENDSVSSKQLSEADVGCLADAATGIRLSAKIVDAPCNEMNVSHFIEEIIKVGNELGKVPTIIRGEELNARGFGGIYGVGKAAEVPPALVVLSHEPAGASESCAWVGKGIVYDTGGLSIKGKTSMPGMKRDCGGAAAILGAFYAIVKAGFNQNLYAVFCLAENAVGPNATR